LAESLLPTHAAPKKEAVAPNIRQEPIATDTAPKAEEPLTAPKVAEIVTQVLEAHEAKKEAVAAQKASLAELKAKFETKFKTKIEKPVASAFAEAAAQDATIAPTADEAPGTTFEADRRADGEFETQTVSVSRGIPALEPESRRAPRS
jgi:hypothetical protein